MSMPPPPAKHTCACLLPVDVCVQGCRHKDDLQPLLLRRLALLLAPSRRCYCRCCFVCRPVSCCCDALQQCHEHVTLQAAFMDLIHHHVAHTRQQRVGRQPVGLKKKNKGEGEEEG